MHALGIVTMAVILNMPLATIASGHFCKSKKQERGPTLNIKEKIVDILYALADIRGQADDEQIQVMSEAMETTAMEMEILVQHGVGWR